jgi:hypothetical protein
MFFGENLADIIGATSSKLFSYAAFEAWRIIMLRAPE